MALADWILPQLVLPGGPVLTPYRSPSGTNQPGPKAVTPPLAGPFDFANAMTSMANVGGENQLRQAQANLYGVQGQQAMATLQMLQRYPDMLQSMFKGGAPGIGQPPSASPATFGSLAPQPDTSSGGAMISDPRGLTPLITQAASKYGIDPATALKVSQSEGLGTFFGDGGTSGGAFQLHVTPNGKGNAVGDQFQRDTGLDPLDPQNEAASIDYAMRFASRHGWGAWNGAKRAGIGEFDGIFGPSKAADAAPQYGNGNDMVPGKIDAQGRIIGGVNAGVAAAPELLASYGAKPQPASAPAPSAISPNFGSLAPNSGPINPGLPGLENFDPVKAVIAGSIMEAYKLPNAAAPMLGLYQNSPGYKAAVEAASKWAAVPPELFTKWNSPMTARPGGGILNPANGGVVGAMPTLQKTTDPTGQESFTYMTPGVGGASPSLVPTGAVAALGPEQAATLKARGTAAGGLPFVQPTAEAQATGSALGEARVNYGDLLKAPLSGAPPLTPQAIPSPSGVPGQDAAASPTAKGWPGSKISADVQTTIPLTTEPPMTPAQLKNDLPEWTKTNAEWSNSIKPAQEAEERLSTIANAFKMIQTGTWRTDKASFDAGLKSLGIPTVFGNVGDVQTALHENYIRTLKTLRAASSRFTQQEFAVISSKSENPDLQPEANLQMLAEDIGIIRQSNALATDWQQAQHLGWHNPLAFQTAWLNANPLTPIVSSIRNEIGPLKGMAGAPNSASAPVAVGPNGHRITLRNGTWVDQKTGQPLPASAPLQ